MPKTQPFEPKSKSGWRIMLVTGDQPIAESLLSYASQTEDLDVVHIPSLKAIENEPTPVGSYDAVVFDLDTAENDEPVAQSLDALFEGAAKVVMGRGRNSSEEGTETADKSKGITDIIRAVGRACERKT